MSSHAPFRADEVGSLLRPQAIKDARAAVAAGTLDALYRPWNVYPVDESWGLCGIHESGHLHAVVLSRGLRHSAGRLAGRYLCLHVV